MNHYIPRHILITGSAGFIGCNFVRHLLATDPQVLIVSLDALTYAGSADNLRELPDPARHVFVHGDICDRALVDRLLREHRIDTVVHFAAESHVDRSITGPAAFVQTNVVGTCVLLDACRAYWQQEQGWDAGNCRFHHVSTDEVYGSLRPDEAPFTETTAYAPNSPYSASKAASDHFVRAYYHTYGLPAVTTNCSNNFGPYQHWEKFIPTVVRHCIERKPIPVYGDGSNIRDWLFVGDHCSGIDLALRRGRPGETYNIGGGNELSNLDLAGMVCGIMDELRPAAAPHQDLVSFVTDRPGHDWRYAIDAVKAGAELGWSRAGSFGDDLRNTIKWYLALSQ